MAMQSYNRKVSVRPSARVAPTGLEAVAQSFNKAAGQFDQVTEEAYREVQKQQEIQLKNEFDTYQANLIKEATSIKEDYKSDLEGGMKAWDAYSNTAFKQFSSQIPERFKERLPQYEAITQNMTTNLFSTLRTTSNDAFYSQMTGRLLQNIEVFRRNLLNDVAQGDLTVESFNQKYSESFASIRSQAEDLFEEGRLSAEAFTDIMMKAPKRMYAAAVVNEAVKIYRIKGEDAAREYLFSDEHQQMNLTPEEIRLTRDAGIAAMLRSDEENKLAITGAALEAEVAINAATTQGELADVYADLPAYLPEATRQRLSASVLAKSKELEKNIEDARIEGAAAEALAQINVAKTVTDIVSVPMPEGMTTAQQIKWGSNVRAAITKLGAENREKDLDELDAHIAADVAIRLQNYALNGDGKLLDGLIELSEKVDDPKLQAVLRTNINRAVTDQQLRDKITSDKADNARLKAEQELESDKRFDEMRRIIMADDAEGRKRRIGTDEIDAMAQLYITSGGSQGIDAGSANKLRTILKDQNESNLKIESGRAIYNAGLGTLSYPQKAQLEAFMGDVIKNENNDPFSPKALEVLGSMVSRNNYLPNYYKETMNNWAAFADDPDTLKNLAQIYNKVNATGDGVAYENKDLAQIYQYSKMPNFEKNVQNFAELMSKPSDSPNREKREAMQQDILQDLDGAKNAMLERFDIVANDNTLLDSFMKNIGLGDLNVTVDREGSHVSDQAGRVSLRVLIAGRPTTLPIGDRIIDEVQTRAAALALSSDDRYSKSVHFAEAAKQVFGKTGVTRVMKVNADSRAMDEDSPGIALSLHAPEKERAFTKTPGNVPYAVASLAYEAFRSEFEESANVPALRNDGLQKGSKDFSAYLGTRLGLIDISSELGSDELAGVNMKLGTWGMFNKMVKDNRIYVRPVSINGNTGNTLYELKYIAADGTHRSLPHWVTDKEGRREKRSYFEFNDRLNGKTLEYMKTNGWSYMFNHALWGSITLGLIGELRKGNDPITQSTEVE